MHLEVLVSEDGTKAFIEWSESWCGGSTSGTRNADGGRSLTELSSWIT